MENVEMLIKNVTRKYEVKNNENVYALNNINMNLENGFIVLLGISGSGKSTLLNMISGLDSPTEGEIYNCNECISNYNQKEWDNYRLKKIGVVFQESNLLEEMDVYNNIALPLRMLRVDEKEIANRVNDILDRIGMRGMGERKIWQLSSGQRQRVAIARGIIKRPDVLILDEPTGNLDAGNSENIFRILSEFKKDCLIVLASHDKDNSYKYADRVIVLKNGRIEDDIRNNIKDGYEVNNIILDIKELEEQIMINSLDDKRIVDFVRLILFKMDLKEKDEVDFNVGIKVNLKRTEGCESVKNNKNTQFYNKTGLRIKEIIKMAYNSLKQRKIRLFFTLALFALSLALVFVSSQIINYDYKQNMGKYLEERNLKYSIVYRETEYEDIFENKIEERCNSGKKLRNDIEEIMPYMHMRNVMYLNWIVVDEDESEPYDIPIIIGDYEEYDISIIGNYPVESNEILIDSVVADKLFSEKKYNELIGSSLFYYDLKLRISGIIEKSDIKIDRYDESGYLIGNEGFVEWLVDNLKYLDINAADLTQYRALRPYKESKMKYGSADILNSSNLVWGRLPEKENEIMVANYVFNALGYDIEDSEEENIKEINLINLNDKKYNNAFDYMNIYDYFPKGIKVVGVYNFSEENEVDASVLVKNNVYQKMKENYCRYYAFDETIIMLGDDKEKLVESIDEINCKLDEKGCGYIYDFDNFVKNIHKLLLSLTCICMGIAIFFIISFMSYSVKDQSRKIGILRTMGMKMKEALLIFVVEDIILTVFSLFIGSFLFILVLNQINNIYMRYMKDVELNIIEVQMKLYFVAVVFSLFIGIISSYIPLKKMSKMKPIDLLNKG